MARPRSEDKRSAILAAATRVIVSQGLGAPTAVIAREAGVANGSLFTYFETKAELLNALYLELKSGMATAALKGFSPEGEGRKQYWQVWKNWMGWALKYPENRRALALLGVCDEITPETRAAAHRRMAAMRELLERIKANGPMRDAPMKLYMALMNAVADSTMDFMLEEPGFADEHCRVGFEALWRMIG